MCVRFFFFDFSLSLFRSFILKIAPPELFQKTRTEESNSHFIKLAYTTVFLGCKNSFTMPGRHGKQRVKRKKSKRLPVTEMEKTLKDSIHGRKRKEKSILKDLIPPKVAPKMNKIAVSASLPMFQPRKTK